MFAGTFILEMLGAQKQSSEFTATHSGLLKITYSNGFITGSRLGADGFSMLAQHGFYTSRSSIETSGVNANLSTNSFTGADVTIDCSISSGSFAGTDGILIRGA